MEKERIELTETLCNTLMDCLACICYSVTGDLEASQDYARSTFVELLGSWEEFNNIEFDILEDEEDTLLN